MHSAAVYLEPHLKPVFGLLLFVPQETHAYNHQYENTYKQSLSSFNKNDLIGGNAGASSLVLKSAHGPRRA